MRNDTNNSIADALVIASDKVKYDANVRNILANKSILAWILKFATDEFKGCDIEEIADCIENPEIGTLGVNPGYISSRTDDKENSVEQPDKITGMSNEDNVPNEGKIVYDIRFSVYKPGVTKDGKNDNGAVLLNLLNVLVDKKLTAGQKQTILKDGYSIEMTHKMREELSGMCNLSDLIEEEGLAKGRAQERYNLINNYMTRKNATLEEACDVIGISPEEYYEAEKLLKEQ